MRPCVPGLFDEREKLEYLMKNPSEQEREPTTNKTHKWRRHQDLSPGHIKGGELFSHHCDILASQTSSRKYNAKST